MLGKLTLREQLRYVKVEKCLPFVLLLLLLLSLAGCASTPLAPKEPAAPVLEFEGCAVEIEAGEAVVRGTLSRTLQSTSTFVTEEPALLNGLTIRSSQTGLTVTCAGLAAEVALPAQSAVRQLLEALDLASRPNALQMSEQGFMGRLSSGDTFSLLTDEAGNLELIVVPGAQIRFAPASRQEGSETA